MKVMAINGSARKEWNTAAILKNALEGAASRGAETTLVNLYDLTYQGCISCFSCKTRGGNSYGKCAVKDDLTPVYEEILHTDALILGSPIYFGDVTGEMRSFMERLLFPHLVYVFPPETLFPKSIPTGMIYTMNAPEQIAMQIGYGRLFESNERTMRMIFGHAESLMSYDTYQFADYTRMVADGIDGVKKKQRHDEVFPQDCRKAYEMGARFACGAPSH